MKSIPNPKLIVFHPSLYKHSVFFSLFPSPHRLLFLTLLSLFTFTFLLTLFNHHHFTPTSTLTTPPTNALLHYTTTTNNYHDLTPSEFTTMTTTLTTCSPHCNFLIFGLSPSTLLFHHHHHHHTVFLDENQHLINQLEHNLTLLEAYDIQYTTNLTQSHDLLLYSRTHRTTDCPPVHPNLLYSDCKLAINDLPNHLYDIPWDLILINGPPGYSPEMPGRMSPIFTAAVLARSKKSKKKMMTHVFVHDFGRDVEKLYSEEFLCRENLVEVVDSLAHFVISPSEITAVEFCNGDEKFDKALPTSY